MNNATVTIVRDQHGRMIRCFVEDGVACIDLPITGVSYSSSANSPGEVQLGLLPNRVNFEAIWND